MTDRLYTYRGRLVRETERAWLVRLDNHAEEVWLPKSECEYDEGSEFVIPDWIADEKDLSIPKGPW